MKFEKPSTVTNCLVAKNQVRIVVKQREWQESIFTQLTDSTKLEDEQVAVPDELECIEKAT